MLENGFDLLAYSSEYAKIPFSREAAYKASAEVDGLKNKKNSHFKIWTVVFWQKLVRGANILFRVGKVLKIFFPQEAVSRWRDSVTLVDKRTMLHPGHVGANSSLVGSEEIKFMIGKQYQAWLEHFGY